MVLPKQTSTTVTMSPGMTSAIFQETLLAHILDLKSKALNVITSGPGASSIKTAQTHLFFIDDLNTAPKTGGMFTISHFVSYCLQGMCCYWNFFYHVETFSFRIMMSLQMLGYSGKDMLENFHFKTSTIITEISCMEGHVTISLGINIKLLSG